MTLTLTSPAFADDETIPRRYGYTEENVNPPLTIGGVPDATESLALVVDDPDAVEPAGTVWDHWVVWNIPPETREIPEAWNAADVVEGQNDYGERGYGGPNPPDREHTYRFLLYALDTVLSLDPGATKDELQQAMEESLLEEALLEGTYAP
ncbi:YbhB/YbcL family Raf kinase inhibitor-like protein [Salinigranum salinum]|uniref:YbhB/YbcL family Raf kinase inhibitor-like protein n=1 Tax=Salinigranum salinum TaxID=1364937 RepID=UPI0012604677|nr:YbhB/YbcL family Raf kinase inhibitor-like protein [Salinigranum salinum]